jgi:hypothetical protein
MIALMCGCGRRLEADEGERLCERVAAHLDRDHMTANVDRELVRGMIASRGYRVWSTRRSTRTGPPRTRSSAPSPTENPPDVSEP